MTFSILWFYIKCKLAVAIIFFTHKCHSLIIFQAFSLRPVRHLEDGVSIWSWQEHAFQNACLVGKSFQLEFSILAQEFEHKIINIVT